VTISDTNFSYFSLTFSDPCSSSRGE